MKHTWNSLLNNDWPDYSQIVLLNTLYRFNVDIYSYFKPWLYTNVLDFYIYIKSLGINTFLIIIPKW